jgi:hypothetical protein
MKVGDLVKITYDTKYERNKYSEDENKIAMIIEGPNEVGKIKVLLSSGVTFWKHTSEVAYMPRNLSYLKE